MQRIWSFIDIHSVWFNLAWCHIIRIQKENQSHNSTNSPLNFISLALSLSLSLFKASWICVLSKLCHNNNPLCFLSIYYIYIYIYIYKHYPTKNGIHKARWCKQRNSPTGECKSNNGLRIKNTSTVFRSPLVSVSILETSLASQEFSGPRVPESYLDKLRPGAFFLLTTHLKGPIDQQITSFSRIIYDVCLECFDAVTHKKR